MRIFTFLLLIVGLNGWAQNVKTVVPKINSVTVFINQAQIESSLSTNLAAGNTKIYIDDIANTIDQNSIQVGGKGDFMLLGVKYSANHLNKKKLALEDSIKSVTREIENLEMLSGVAKNEERMIMANANVKSEQDGLSGEELKEMIEVFRTKLTEVGKRALEINRKLEFAKIHKKELEEQLNESRNINLPLGRIELSVSANKPTAANISLSYVASNAGWNPNYDLRVKDTKSPVNINYKASVYQNTGIDWKDVKLILSTSNPMISGQKPELFPQYLSFNEPIRYYKTARVVENEMVAAPLAMADMTSVSQINKVIETGMAVNFEIGTLYSIPSSGIAELVEIQNYTVEADYAYSIIPKLSNDAYLTATLQNWEKLKLLSGEANLYFEDKFVGKSFIKEQNTDDKLVLSLGRDTRIYAKREEIENYKARKTLGSNIKENFGYKTTIKNNKSEVVKIVLEDQIPVSQDSDIFVDVNELSGGTVDNATGKIKYEFNLEPMKNKEIVLEYTVKYPKDKKIYNL